MLLIRKNHFSKINVKTSTPPVEPPPINVTATPNPTMTPPTIAKSIYAPMSGAAGFGQ